MKDCPRDLVLGRPLCNIVAHPEKHHHSFCTNCPKRFVEKGSDSDFEWFWLLIIMVVIVVVLTAK